ncbi:MAG: 1-deoxy-D-xylulose-5-phosphate synthase [Bacillota bacterium]|jgi:1-deoxy-D-xylulose-5-phosphate synthase
MVKKYLNNKINKAVTTDVTEKILPKINSPADLKNLSSAQLQSLAEEIRLYIIDVVAENGGHLAPSLGVVELTIALHRVLDVPTDKLIWDVGHQVYAHKIITGRREKFHTLRAYEGLSGFPKREESPADPFGAGHASTALSAALAFAKARDIKKENYRVAAVVGDGAFTGGLSYEALCHCGDLGSNMLIILNDNEMSIDSNVGAMSNYLMKIRTSRHYTDSKQELENLLRKIPQLGPLVAENLKKLKDSFKHLWLPGMIFEELGIFYLGPVNGHDIAAIEGALMRAKTIKGPVLLHVLTTKGKGYLPAEINPDVFHGTGAFHIGTGQAKKMPPPFTYSSVFGDAMCKMAAENENIVAVTAAMTSGTGLLNFFAQYPERSFDVGIAEGHAVTFAAGLAAAGLHPVVAIYSTFMQRAYDNILHDVCLQKLPVILALDRAGLVGDDGPTHHGVFDIAYLSSIPNLIIMAPMDENELQSMLRAAVSYQAPVAIRYPRGSSGLETLSAETVSIPLGKGQILVPGDDLTIIACGSMVAVALEVADILSNKNISAEVINARFIAPLDQELLLKSATKTRRVLTLEEGIKKGGLGEACAELLRQEMTENSAEVEIGALPNSFIAQGKKELLLDDCNLTPPALVKKVCQRWFNK